MKHIDYLLLLLPVLLWPLTFVVLHSVFIYAMLVSTFILAAISLSRYKDLIKWRHKNIYVTVASGILGAIALYLIFVGGNYATLYLHVNGLVGNVYSTIYSSVSIVPLTVMLAFIGLFEEVYWRGALQGYMYKNVALLSGIPWIGSSIYYSLVHISTLNPILVLAALVVGLMTGSLAHRYGIISSIITHIMWIELIVVLFPVVRI